MSADGRQAPQNERARSAADHVALRALIKYLSKVMDVPYKTIADRSGLNESAVKNYANDKSSRSTISQEMHQAFSRACGTIITEAQPPMQLDAFAIGMLLHLFGPEWLEASNISLPDEFTRPQMTDTAIAAWLGLSKRDTDVIEERYKGLWRLVRLASPPGQQDINMSLLNIKPRGSKSPELCQFQLFYLGRGAEPTEYVTFEGYVIPNVDRIDFIGKARGGHRLITLMSWRFAQNDEITKHADTANGIGLFMNTTNSPVGTRVRAFFVKDSENLENGAFDDLRRREIEGIGVKNISHLGERIAADQLDRTLRYIKEFEPVVGFLGPQDDNRGG